MDKAREADILAKGIFEAIESVAKNITKKTLKQRGIEQTLDGVVLTVDENNNTADVDCGYEIFNALPNKSGESLKVGDAVRIFAKSDLLTDMYIGATVTMRTI